MLKYVAIGRRKLLAAALAMTTSIIPLTVASAEEVLKAVLSARLGVLDPIATTSYATRTFAYMVYDTLISMDAEGNFHPQMLKGWEVSEDGLTYDFTLREGLKFSDGADVTPEDVVASINRWGERDSFGKRMIAKTKEISVTGDKTFQIALSEPFGHVIEALGKPSSNVPVIMPARIASVTPAKEAVTEIVGSGPFVFVSEDWSPGDIAVFEKSPTYVPRDEPTSGLAGGKAVNFDRVEFVTIPDSATQIAALQAGEIDYIQSTAHDFVPILEADPNVDVLHFGGIDQTLLSVVINHLTPPFDNKKVRQALQALAITEQYMAGLGLGEAQWTKDCYSFFMCDTTYGNDAGVADLPERSVENAKKLLAESGYNGELVRILLASSVNDINHAGQVLEGLMKEAGFNVEVQAADWPTVAKARWSKEPVENGGWSLMPVTWSGYDMVSPFTNYRIANNCTDGYAGWACVDEITDLIAAFEAESDVGKRQEIMKQIQTLSHDNVQFLVLGQYSRSESSRKEITGWPKTGLPIFWGAKRN